jgi:hypothetical protein
MTAKPIKERLYMASVRTLKKFGIPFGIEILLSHKEVETITKAGEVAPALKLPPKAVAAIDNCHDIRSSHPLAKIASLVLERV